MKHQSIEGIAGANLQLTEHVAISASHEVDAIEPATIDITTDPNGIRAWLAALTRT